MLESIWVKITATLLAGLAVWLIAKFYNRSRLTCAPSRLYDYSDLVDGGSTVQLIIANRGRQVEEGVEVQLSTDYEYSLVASTQNMTEIGKDKCIRFDALLPSAEIGIVFVAEGRPRFSMASIRHIRSKRADGKIGASIGEIDRNSTTQLAVILALVPILLVGFAMGTLIGQPLWYSVSTFFYPRNQMDFREGCLSVRSNGDPESQESGLSEETLKLLALGSVAVKQVDVKGDQLVVGVSVESLMSSKTELSVKLESHAADSSVYWSRSANNFVYDIILIEEGELREYELTSFFPTDRRPKRFWLETRLELAGYWVTVERSYFFGEDSSMTCPAPTDGVNNS